MKKIIMAMAAVAMLCAGLTSCSSESDIDEIISNETQEQEITFDFNFSAGSDADTRATQKTEWVAGDIIYVGFKEQIEGLLKFTYDGTNWSAPTTIGTIDLNTVASNASKNSKKKCCAFWVEGNPGDSDLELVTDSGYKFATSGQCDLHEYNVNYSYDENTKKISASFTLKRNINTVKIAVSGLGDDTWQICAKEFLYTDYSYLDNGSSVYAHTKIDNGANKAFGGGYKIGNETCFYAFINSSVTSRDEGSIIYLKNTATDKIYRKQFAGKKLDTMGGKTINITFNASVWQELTTAEWDALTSDNMDLIDATTGTLNGHTWVDLGLPSGTKWAACNLGADSPTDYGDYYAWGETQPKTGFSSSTSATYDKTIDQLRAAGIIDGNNNLTSTYDAATANWGTDWRMPTDTEFQELIDNCTWTWKTSGNSDYNGKAGYEVRGSNGNTIFFPAAYYYQGNTLKKTYDHGRYWSSTDKSESSLYSYYLYLDNQEYASDGYLTRYYGLTIRPVTK